LCITVLLAWRANAASVRACAAEVEYPPFLFSANASVAQGTHAAGYALDVLQLALKNAGKGNATVERLPWLRCLRMAEVGQMDVVVNVPTAQIDPKPYWITDPYAELHSAYFYSLKSRPKGIKINNLQELTHYNVCGLMGNSYEAYGLDLQRVDTGARTYVSLIRKLEAGYCDVFIEKREVVDSLAARDRELRELLGQSSLVRRDLPEDLPSGLHFAISRRFPDGESLQASFNETISKLRSSKEDAAMLQPYLKY
jgi:polar amino acid transport system substrate-binding protein